MQEITHCVNQRPIYETENSEIFEWNDSKQVEGIAKENREIIYHPVVFDIETSAELNQKPILCVAYNSLEKTVIILYNHGYEGYVLDYAKAEKMVSDIDYNRLIVDNLSMSKFEQYILEPIAEWNEKAKQRNDTDRMSLVAHNAEYDIPMMGRPNDELLDNPKIDNRYEQCVQYKNINMVGHRAGQFGHLYTFLDSSKNFEHLHIPVGDTLVGAKSLWIPGKLKDACEHMRVDIEVSEAENHGMLTDQYLEYCINDVYATFKLYLQISRRLNNMFGHLPIEHIYSTASIGKYVLREMGYKRPGYEQEAIDRIVPAYFGGRTEAKVTGEIIENLRYTDILSQYPTVSKLTNVWDYMQCEKVGIQSIEPNELPEIQNMTDPDNWEKVRDYYVKVKPNGATLPVRTPHLEDTTKVVTANVHSEKAIHYHYMDLISAKLIDGEEKFDIVAAWEVTKEGKQNLESFEIADVKIDAYDNIMAKCIEARKNIQKKEGKNSKTKSLKITANSMYGISAERIVKKKDGEKNDYASHNGYYNPHVATTITAGGRLMLALGEKVANQNNADIKYCDTDSFIIPDKCKQEVIGAFENLNPYDGYAGTLDVLEDEKEQIGKLYATGTKKYIFFGNDGEILEYKEHGLGNYDNLRDSETIKQLWATIIYYDLGKEPLNSDLLYEYKLDENVIWSFNCSTRSMRVMISEFTQDTMRYGDWVQSTISYDNNIRYMALNIEEKQDKDKLAKAYMHGEEVEKVESVEKSEMNGNDKLKTVRDIVRKFVQDSAGSDERPNVKVTNKKIVTKESTNRKDIFITKLEEQFKRNMSNGIQAVFGKVL
jgi:hypothetical protein